MSVTVSVWWTTTGRGIYTTYNSAIATSQYDETLAINILERDRDLVYNASAQTRNSRYDAADQTKLAAQRAQSRDAQITKVGHVQVYQQAIADATETNTITPDETVLTTTVVD